MTLVLMPGSAFTSSRLLEAVKVMRYTRKVPIDQNVHGIVRLGKENDDLQGKTSEQRGNVSIREIAHYLGGETSRTEGQRAERHRE
jgi:hypothetical protein